MALLGLLAPDDHAAGFGLATQVPVASLPWRANNDAKPASVPGNRADGKQSKATLSPIRRAIRSLQERRGMDRGPLTGSPFAPASDPFGTGLLIEGADVSGAAGANAGFPDNVPLGVTRGAPGITGADMADAPPMGDADPSGAHDDITQQIKRIDENPQFSTLHTFRQANPNIPVINVTYARTVIVGTTAREWPIPDGAIAVRFTHINTSNGLAAVFVSFDQKASFPTNAVSDPGNPHSNEGSILIAPSSDFFYYCKGRTTLSGVTNNAVYLTMLFIM